MKVLYVITGLGVGGAETQLLAVAQKMADKHEVRICFLTGEREVGIGCSGLKIESLNLKKTYLDFFEGISKLRALVVQFEPDIVHSHMVHANILARLVRLTTKMPRLICSAHSTNEGGWLRMLAYRVTDPLATVTTNVSKEAALSFEQKSAVPKGKMVVVANGIDTLRFKPDHDLRSSIRHGAAVKPLQRIILAVGRLVPVKDYPSLISAFAILSKDDENLQLWIVGEGSEALALRKLVVDLRLVNRVSFLGARADIAALYNAADLFVLSSAWEGFGLVVAEAMATERVVVATDCGGVREVLGEHGFLVPARDSGFLARAMQQALDLTAEESAKIGRQARGRIIKHFALDRAVKRWQQIYHGHECGGNI
jgi:glycosyltransferase involved in cell wall biosynthesis